MGVNGGPSEETGTHSGTSIYPVTNSFSLGSIRLTLPGINMEVENLLVVEDFMVFQGAIFHFHVSSRECISREAY